MTARVILLALLLAQLADAATFAVGAALHGIRLESNGFAVLAYGASGVSGVLLLKGAALLLVLGVIVLTAPRFPRLLIWGGAVGTSMGLLGFLTNVTSLMLVAH